MTLFQLTIELSDEEIDILEQLAEQDHVTPNEALRKAIREAGYLRQQSRSDKNILIGTLEGGNITGNSNVMGVNTDNI
ncbi:CopG family transcriptional regulator [Nodularia harveyana UHCC-0300]|uniref:CopG family transcriptional regulator n=1 Tax=Nodularia harveyana UHCC-0300 TaxID=2974287 RepID=A0ABU5UB38_9CYAN|nr:CopG family transcriptional regulator [Nodularia harveyana]MEA5580161.1 CopG family transcriptional regulator [Nodularia harveyana UHCC-0300]